MKISRGGDELFYEERPKNRGRKDEANRRFPQFYERA